MSNYRLAIDVGNTRTHAGLVDLDRSRCVGRKDIPTSRIDDELLAALHSVLQPVSAPTVQSIVANIACGVESMAGLAEDAVRRAGVQQIRRVAHHPGLPVRFEYDRPANFGADRIADCLCAQSRYPRKDVVVIDCGTAITTNLLGSDGVCRGGTIMPGPRLQLESLHKGAPALPFLADLSGEPRIPGSSTRECIASGVLYGTAGALDRILSRYAELLGGRPVVVTTGGAWPVLANHVGFRGDHIPDCTLIGTALFELEK